MRKFLIAGLIVLILVGAAIAQTGVISGASVLALNASVARTLGALFADETNAVNYGADPTGVADSTAAINAALATGRSVYLPTGHYKVTNALAVGAHTVFHGDSPHSSFLEVGSNFNSSATGVIVLTGREYDSPIVRDIGINFAQPTNPTSRATFATLAAGCTTTTTGTGCKYPPAIYNDTANRFKVQNFYAGGAWDGIVFKPSNSSGGFFLQSIEMGALNKGLDIENTIDFGHITDWHSWAFGLNAGTMFANVYADGQTISASFGATSLTQAISVTDFASFYARVLINNAGSWMQFTNLQLDGEFSKLEISDNFFVQITNMYFTGGGGTGCGINVSGGATTYITNFYIASSVQSGVCQTGGVLALSNGIILPTATGVKAIYTNPGSYAVLDVHDVSFSMNTGAGLWTVPVVDIHGTTYLVFKNNTFNGATGTETGLSIATNLSGNFIRGNAFGGWATTIKPTVAACTSPVVTEYDGPQAFTFSVGSPCSSVNNGTITLPVAPTGWICSLSAVTAPGTRYVAQTGGSTTTATFASYSRTTGAATNFTANDVIRGSCSPY